MARYSIGAALSSYRPDPIIARLARKEVARLPFTVRASKPSYYGERDNHFHEHFYVSEQFAMGTLYDPTPGDKIVGEVWPQTTQFKLAVRAPSTTLVFGVANPYHRHFPVEGRSLFDQYHQEKGALVNVCFVPAEATKDARATRSSLLAVPAGLPDPMVTANGWYVFSAGETFVAVRPLGTAPPRWVDLSDWTRRTQDAGAKIAAYPEYRWLQTDGALCGWVVDTGTRAQFASTLLFARALNLRTRLDLSRFASERVVTYTSLQNDTLILRHTGGPGGKPDVSTNGKPLVFKNWPVYESPFLSQPLRSGVLSVSDGRERLVVDFSGEQPVWRKSEGEQFC